jgi:dTMP kinase
VSGRFIALEGVDGCGKSTQAALLAAALRSAGHTVVETREPGGTPLGDAVRGIVLDSGGDMSPVAEALLFAASRAQHVAQIIRPALASDAWVVCDRFVDSSLAYQGAARGLGIDAVWAINAPAVDGCLPDLAIVLDVAPAIAGTRDAGHKDRIEVEGIALQQAVAAGYHELAARFGDRITIIPAEGSVDHVHVLVMTAVERIA